MEHQVRGIVDLAPSTVSEALLSNAGYKVHHYTFEGDACNLGAMLNGGTSNSNGELILPLSAGDTLDSQDVLRHYTNPFTKFAADGAFGKWRVGECEESSWCDSFTAENAKAQDVLEAIPPVAGMMKRSTVLAVGGWSHILPFNTIHIDMWLRINEYQGGLDIHCIKATGLHIHTPTLTSDDIFDVGAMVPKNAQNTIDVCGPFVDTVAFAQLCILNQHAFTFPEVEKSHATLRTVIDPHAVPHHTDTYYTSLLNLLPKITEQATLHRKSQDQHELAVVWLWRALLRDGMGDAAFALQDYEQSIEVEGVATGQADRLTLAQYQRIAQRLKSNKPKENSFLSGLLNSILPQESEENKLRAQDVFQIVENDEKKLLEATRYWLMLAEQWQSIYTYTNASENLIAAGESIKKAVAMITWAENQCPFKDLKANGGDLINLKNAISYQATQIGHSLRRNMQDPKSLLLVKDLYHMSICMPIMYTGNAWYGLALMHGMFVNSSDDENAKRARAAQHMASKGPPEHERMLVFNDREVEKLHDLQKLLGDKRPREYRIDCSALKAKRPLFAVQKKRRFAITVATQHQTNTSPNANQLALLRTLMQGTFVGEMRMLHYGLLALGYDSILTTLSDCLSGLASPDCTSRQLIVFAPTAVAQSPDLQNNLPNGTILVQQEQIFKGSPYMTNQYVKLLSDPKYRVWDYNHINQQVLSDEWNIKSEVLEFGYGPQLSILPSMPETIDIVFFGSMNPRRMKILHDLQSRGYSVAFLEAIVGSERDWLIAQAKVVLNVHYYESKRFELNRVFFLLCNNKLVVSEASGEPSEDEPWASGVVFAPYEDVVATVEYYLAHPEEREKVKLAARLLLLQRASVKYLEPLVARYDDDCRESEASGSACIDWRTAIKCTTNSV
jgi:hypothetical protein